MVNKEAILRGLLLDIQDEKIVEFKLNKREATATFEDGVTITIPIEQS